MRVVAPALPDAQHLHAALGRLDRGAQASGARANDQYGGGGAPLLGLGQRARGDRRLHTGDRGGLAIIASYAAGSIRVVMAIRFQALITVIAHTS
jgi:hypothetical protein